MPKVLLISLQFPPFNASASYRAASLAKYLPRFGWEPTVVCGAWPESRGDYDPDFVPGIPSNIRIFRIDNPDPVPGHMRNFFRRCRHVIAPHLVPFVWWQSARRRIDTLIHGEKFDLIWATSPPLATIALADRAHRKTGVPWVADFRDAAVVQKYATCVRARPTYLLWEKLLLRTAALCVTVSSGLAEPLSAFHAKPFHVIENGFDPEFLSGSKCFSFPKFRISYTGNIILPHRSPALFLGAVQEGIRRGLFRPGDLKIAFFGADGEAVRKCCPEVITLPIEILPRIPHADCIRVQKNSTVLLQIAHPCEKGIFTGKVFDYLASQRPIIAAPGDGDCLDALLKTTGAGVSCHTRDAVISVLSQWYDTWRSTGTVPYAGRIDEVMKYSREELAGKYAALFYRVVNSAATGAPRSGSGIRHLQGCDS